jgi:DNA-binding transcriptional LysR family regulator
MGIVMHIAAEVEHIQTALMMVQAAIGITFVPATLSAIPSVGAIFRRVHLMQNSITVQAVWATDDPSGLVAQFLRTARAIAAADQAGM